MCSSDLPARHLKSKHFDCVRHVIPQLEGLRKGRDEPFIPTTDEIGEYFASATFPIRLPNGKVNIPPDILPFVLRHTSEYGRRRLFATQRGYLGLGPASLEAGDIVCLVPNFNPPVILRPAEGMARILPPFLRTFLNVVFGLPRFKFVGQAYVHGIMHGEAAKEFRDRDVMEYILI